MRDVWRLLGAALLAAAFTPALALRPVPAGVDAREVERAASEILCDCGCHPQSIKDCACGHADMLWEQITAEVAAGRSGDDIIADRVARFGEKILVSPKARGFSLVAWLGPGVALGLAALGLVWGLRRWAAASSLATATASAPAAPPDTEYLRRVRRDVEESR